MSAGPGREVLMVAFRFPPQGGVGALRSAALARHLPTLGWTPTVLAGPGDAFRRGWIDETHLEDLDPSVRIRRTAGLDLGPFYRGARRLGLGRPMEVLTPFLPGLRAGWSAAAYRRGRSLLRTGRFDVVYSSSPPFASHLVAWRLSRDSGLPWVADYRDLWSPQERLRWPTHLHRACARRLEGRVVRGAARIVTTSAVARDRMMRAFPHVAPRVSLVLNGFEPAFFEGPPAVPPGRPPGFLVSHVGSLPTGRHLDPFLDAVRAARSAGELGADFHVRLVGPSINRPFTDELSDVIRAVGPVDHRTAVAWMRSSDLLLLVKASPTKVAAKTFEYLATRKPVLALAAGATAALVHETGAGDVVDPADVEAIRRALVAAYRRWKAGDRIPPPPVDLEPYSRRRMAAGLAELLEDATAVRAGRPRAGGPA